jgi:xanthine dehydrogenase molybdopterin-binding subunit B
MRRQVATQAPGFVAAAVARCLRVDEARVEARMARAGGGYGGKASRSIPCAVAAACASWLVEAPVAIALPINDNMAMLGSRRPHRFDYTVGVGKDGTIQAVTGTSYAIQGCDSDMGGLASAMDVAFCIDGPCRAAPTRTGPIGRRCADALVVARVPSATDKIANWDVEGYCCKTDTPINTLCRGPIWLPAHLMIEGVVEQVASACGLDPHDVRLKNLYQPGDTALGGQKLPNCTLPRLVASVCEKASYVELRASVASFNATSKYVKQGLALSPFRYGMGAASGYAAHVTVKDDGSVVISQSGCEIGQGLYVKQAQVAAQTLGVDISLVRVDGVTSKVSTAPTGGSTTSEANAASVRLACEDVLRKLAPVRAALQTQMGRTPPRWSEIVAAAVRAGADKTGYGCYSGAHREVIGGQVVLPGPSGYGHEQYCAFGAALTHLRYNALTAELTVLRAEIVTDQGAPSRVPLVPSPLRPFGRGEPRANG